MSVSRRLVRVAPLPLPEAPVELDRGLHPEPGDALAPATLQVARGGLVPAGGHGRPDRRGQGEADQRRRRRPPPGPLPGALPGGRRPGPDRAAGQVTVQVVGQFRGRGVPPRRLLLQALQADRLQVAGDPGVDLRGGRRRSLPDLQQGLGDRPARERRPARQEGIEDGPQAVHVGRRRHRPALPRRLLGGHVRRRPDDRAGEGQLAGPADPLGQPEVADEGPALFVEQDIGRLEVAVQNAPPVRVVDGPGHDRRQPRGGPGFEGVVCQPLVQGSGRRPASS